MRVRSASGLLICGVLRGREHNAVPRLDAAGNTEQGGRGAHHFGRSKRNRREGHCGNGCSLAGAVVADNVEGSGRECWNKSRVVRLQGQDAGEARRGCEAALK